MKPPSLLRSPPPFLTMNNKTRLSKGPFLRSAMRRIVTYLSYNKITTNMFRSLESILTKLASTSHLTSQRFSSLMGKLKRTVSEVGSTL